MEFKKSTSPEDLNKRTLEAQKKIGQGGPGAREAHFELNNLAENADDFREEFEQANKDWDNLPPKEKIENRRQAELKKMLKEKAIEITEQNFNFKLFGVPDGFDLDSDNTKDGEEKDFYQMFYNADKSIKSLELVKNRFGKIIYAYKRNNLFSAENRAGSFFGMSIELDGIYCTDFEKLERLFDLVFEKLILEKYNLIKETTNPEVPYIFNVNSLRNKKVQQDILEIKNILLKNLKKAFAEDFRKSDENFKKFDKIARRYTLHEITKVTKYIDNKGVEKNIKGSEYIYHKNDIEAAEIKKTAIEETKPFDSNYFDFDRNAINAKYNKELENLEK